MKLTDHISERKAATRGLHVLAIGGIVAVLVLAGAALVVIGPDEVNASEAVIEPVQ